MISLPYYLTAQSAWDTLQVCYEAIGKNSDVDVNAKNLKFIDPFGIALLGATFFTIRDQGYSVRVHNLNKDMERYLRRMDVFDDVEIVGNSSDVEFCRHNRADALVELTRIHHPDPDKIDRTASRLANALVGRFSCIDCNESPDEMTGYTTAERFAEPIQYALTELITNGLTHARKQGYPSTCVWVASQYYPKNKIVRVGVVDNGCGFLATLRNNPELRRQEHLDAILTALKPRVSCNRDLGVFADSANEGVGLTMTYRIAERAGGKLVIASGNAVHDTRSQVRRNQSPSDTNWQGVAIGVECKRDALLEVRIRELLPVLDGQAPRNLRFE